MRKQRQINFTVIAKLITDQRLCFRYIDSTIPLLSKSGISSLQPSSVAVQPGNPGDEFSLDVAHISTVTLYLPLIQEEQLST